MCGDVSNEKSASYGKSFFSPEYGSINWPVFSFFLVHRIQTEQQEEGGGAQNKKELSYIYTAIRDEFYDSSKSYDFYYTF